MARKRYLYGLYALAAIAIVIDLVVGLSPWDKELRKYSFLLVMISAGSALIIFTLPYLRKFFEVGVFAKFLPYSRIVYSLLCLFTAVQHMTLISSGMEPENLIGLGIESPSLLAYLTSGIYIGALLLLLFGRWIRIAWILVFLTGIFIIPHNLELFIKNIINFYAIFLPPYLWKGEKRQASEIEGWPLLMMGFSLTFLISGAGIFKILDPIWLEGLGLYYSLNIPFFPPEHLWFLLEYENVLYVLNVITILTEIIAFPLFLFRKTRPFAIVGAILLGFFLAYPMWGIGIVGGPIILSIIPALIAISPETVHFLKMISQKVKPALKGQNNERSLTSEPSAKSPVKASNVFFVVGVVVFWYTILGMINETLWEMFKKKKFPPAYTSFKSKGYQWYQVPEPINYRIELLQASAYHSRPKRFAKMVWLIPLFDYHHLFDRAFFKVVFHGSNNKQYEPITYFKEDGSFSSEYPLWGSERFLATCWKIMLLTQRNISPGDKISYEIRHEFEAVIKYTKSYLPDSVSVKSAIISAKPIHQPYKYEGNSKPWKNYKWQKIYRYDYSSQEGELLGMVERYDFKKLEVPAFKNQVIISK